MEMPVLNGLQTLEQIVQEKLDVKGSSFCVKTARGLTTLLKHLNWVQLTLLQNRVVPAAP